MSKYQQSCTLCANTGEMIDEYGRNRGPCHHCAPTPTTQTRADYEARVSHEAARIPGINKPLGEVERQKALGAEVLKRDKAILDKLAENDGAPEAPWTPKVGDRVLWQMWRNDRTGDKPVTVVCIAGKRACIETASEWLEVVQLDTLRPLPKPKKIVTVREYRSVLTAGGTFWTGEAYSGCPPTGRTHTWEESDE